MGYAQAEQLSSWDMNDDELMWTWVMSECRYRNHHLIMYIYAIHIMIYTHIWIYHELSYIYIYYTCTYKTKYHCKSIDTMELSYPCYLVIQASHLPGTFSSKPIRRGTNPWEFASPNVHQPLLPSTKSTCAAPKPIWAWPKLPVFRWFHQNWYTVKVGFPAKIGPTTGSSFLLYWRRPERLSWTHLVSKKAGSVGRLHHRCLGRVHPTNSFRRSLGWQLCWRITSTQPWLQLKTCGYRMVSKPQRGGV